jgi:hypothetical protein
MTPQIREGRFGRADPGGQIRSGRFGRGIREEAKTQRLMQEVTDNADRGGGKNASQHAGVVEPMPHNADPEKGASETENLRKGVLFFRLGTASWFGLVPNINARVSGYDRSSDHHSH